MKKTIIIVITIAIAIVISIWGYLYGNHALKGFYQSEMVDGYFIQMLFQEADKSYIEWIDNREVDRGTYKEVDSNLYRIMSVSQDFEIKLNRDNSFELIINKLNNGKPIMMNNITSKDHGMSFGEWDDVEEYKSLLDI